MLKLISELILLANLLDKRGFYNQASIIDNIVKIAMNLPNNFWTRKKINNDCWEWQGAKNNGYGVITINGKTYSVHRLAWEWANKRRIPKGQVLLHIVCDNPCCFNPAHLQPGSTQENIADRVEKDRSAKGENNGRAKLTKKDIKKIRKLRSKGWSERAISELIGCGRSTISHVLRGDSWADI